MARKANESKSSKRKIRATEKAIEALELRVQGFGFRVIGEKLGIPTSTAYDAVMGALREANEQRIELAEEVRRLEIERLDRLLAVLWPEATEPGLGAVDRVLRIMERRARLCGLDAPAAHELTGPGGGPIEFQRVEMVVVDPAPDAGDNATD